MKRKCWMPNYLISSGKASNIQKVLKLKKIVPTQKANYFLLNNFNSWKFQSSYPEKANGMNCMVAQHFYNSTGLELVYQFTSTRSHTYMHKNERNYNFYRHNTTPKPSHHTKHFQIAINRLFSMFIKLSPKDLTVLVGTSGLYKGKTWLTDTLSFLL